MAAHILVIEDNPDNRKLVTWILEDEGYCVTCTESAEKGLELLDERTAEWSPFNLILMDISLPDLDGKEATRQIRSLPRFNNIPIIALTAHAVKGEHQAILDAGVSDLITKPLDEELLLDRISEFLANTE